ncbi:ABC transporter [Starkeya sp. ORNL1]|uniref:ABC-type transport auxiliary lipoprotein family protein n=1 Tax=Starkeya sp. ORNL1 TaxID=2709380 RepID=UPI0014628257|nr:ABC-type transport auxiliary lipoprotein family protein [Starkeya sp. ORNL1]QJP12280.1 ABC transporter [Starkeya sp. ORNL1]
MTGFERFGRTARIAAVITLQLSLASALGGCAALLGGGSKAVPTFDLTAPSNFTAPRTGTGQLLVGAPTALAVLDTEKILVEPAPGQITYLSDAQWSDRLPALFQARLIESFENGNRARSVSRPGSGVTADYALLTDLRSFGIQAYQGNEAVVEVSAKIVNDRTGRIAAAQVFKARVAAEGTAGAQATRALDQASDQVFVEMVKWASARF